MYIHICIYNYISYLYSSHVYCVSVHVSNIILWVPNHVKAGRYRPSAQRDVQEALRVEELEHL